MLLHRWSTGQSKTEKQLRVFLLSSSCFIVSLIILSPVEFYFFNQKAYADGLSQENLPPASIGNRQASLYLKVNPPVLTTGAAQNAYMQFRLFDANNNQTIQHVTYEITVTRGTSASTLEKPLLLDFFHAHNGLLTLKVEPTNAPLTIFGEQDRLGSGGHSMFLAEE
jgi:hypothetical protein